MIRAIYDRVELRCYSVFEGSKNRIKFSEFLKKLNNEIHWQPAYLVLDNLLIHHSKLVQETLRAMPNL
jgi:hypothetical protein